MRWRRLGEGILTLTDSTEMSTCWLAFGDALHPKYAVPIGVSVTGQGGAPVIAWEPGKPAFVRLMNRVRTMGPGRVWGCTALGPQLPVVAGGLITPGQVVALDLPILPGKLGPVGRIKFPARMSYR